MNVAFSPSADRPSVLQDASASQRDPAREEFRLGKGNALALAVLYGDGIGVGRMPSGEKIARDNPSDYLDASDHMCRAMQCFRAGDMTHGAPGLPPRDREVIAELIVGLRDDDEAKRHADA